MRVEVTLLILASCAGTFDPALERGESSSDGGELSATASISSTSAAEDEGGSGHASGSIPGTESGSAEEASSDATESDGSDDSGGGSSDGSTGCGDGVRSQDEECDGDDLDDATCQQLDMPGGGSLKCASDCTFDVSGCSLGGPQPEGGLWSRCEFAEDCLDVLDGLCEDNFCSVPCESSADCGPSPGGTAVADCRPIAPENPEQGGHCYLSCENGESCPAGMACWGASYCRSLT